MDNTVLRSVDDQIGRVGDKRSANMEQAAMEAHSSIRAVHHRLEALRDRIVGPMPNAPATAAKDAQPMGSIKDVVVSLSASTLSTTQDMHDILSQLENEI